MKNQVRNFLINLAQQGYNIRWVQGLIRFENGKEYVKMYDTQNDLDLGRIEVTKENVGDLKDTEIGDLVRAVKYPLLDPEVLKKHIEGMIKVDPRYKKYEGLKEEIEEVKKEAKAVIKDAKEYLEDLSYEEQAQQLADKLGVKLTVISSTYGYYWEGDKQKRSIFKLRLSKEGRQYTFKFGQSIAAGNKKPTMYDVLTCLQKYDVGTFEDFCDEFGYDTDSRSAERIYKAVVKEYNAMSRLFTEEELEQLQEIQ